MAWAEIFKRDTQYVVYLNDGYAAEGGSKTTDIIKKLKPMLDLIDPMDRDAPYGWLKWGFSEEEFRAMMGEESGEGDGQAT